MKPKNKEQRALLLRDSMRGGFIISQALLLAIESIESRPKMEQEPSNVADMQLLLDELFPMYKPVHEINTAGKLLQDDVKPVSTRHVEVKASVNYDKPGK